MIISVWLLTAFTDKKPGDYVNKPHINWETERPLQYQDFRGSPSHQHLAAMTASAIEVSYELKAGNIKAEVHARFYPDDSWMKKHARIPKILAHEQRHFDITEWHARQLRKSLSEAKIKGNNVEQVQEIIRLHYAKWQAAQKAYDAETNHGLKPDEQLKWDKKVAKGLDELRKYSF